MRESRQQALNLAKIQEEQVNSLKLVLNSTIAVKIKYENIIKLLVENEHSREFVLTAIETMQHPTQATVMNSRSSTPKSTTPKNITSVLALQQ